jgi:hypothetical protein
MLINESRILSLGEEVVQKFFSNFILKVSPHNSAYVTLFFLLGKITVVDSLFTDKRQDILHLKQ